MWHQKGNSATGGSISIGSLRILIASLHYDLDRTFEQLDSHQSEESINLSQSELTSPLLHLRFFEDITISEYFTWMVDLLEGISSVSRMLDSTYKNESLLVELIRSTKDNFLMFLEMEADSDEEPDPEWRYWTLIFYREASGKNFEIEDTSSKALDCIANEIASGWEYLFDEIEEAIIYDWDWQSSHFSFFSDEFSDANWKTFRRAKHWLKLHSYNYPLSIP